MRIIAFRPAGTVVDFCSVAEGNIYCRLNSVEPELKLIKDIKLKLRDVSPHVSNTHVARRAVNGWPHKSLIPF